MCIKDVSKENRGKYFCIGCGSEMSAALGNVREHYFRHTSENSCSSETYLHKLGKLVLKRRFYSDKPFIIMYMAAQTACPNREKCRLRALFNCEENDEKKLRAFDLKETFDTCEEEGCVGMFRADLKLSHSKYPNRVLLLEIAVSHDCSEEKIHSGKHIIEIKIEKEADLLRPIIESSPSQVKQSFPKISFYNFKGKVMPKQFVNKISVLRAKNTQIQFSYNRKISCMEAIKHLPEAFFEVYTSTFGNGNPKLPVLCDLVEAIGCCLYPNSLYFLSCKLCKRYNRCIMKRILPLECKICRSFSLNEAKCREIIELYPHVLWMKKEKAE